MKIEMILTVCLLLVALAMTFFGIGEAHADNCAVEWMDDSCNDGNLRNGYWWRREAWVPGLITMESHFLFTPQFSSGRITYYTPGTMEATAAYMGFSLEGYLDGISLLGCAEIGGTAWIRQTDKHLWSDGKTWDGGKWEGPFLVVDCAEWDDHWAVTVSRLEVAEVGFKTAERWGMVEKSWRGIKHHEYVRWGEVWIGVDKPPEWIRGSIVYPEWFLKHAMFIQDWQWMPYKPAFFNDPPRWYFGDAVGFRYLLDEYDAYHFPYFLCVIGLRMCMFSHIVW